MGTYYKAVNRTRREFIEPATFGQTMKVQEFTEEPAGIMEALALLLLEGGDGDVVGRWAGGRIIFASVYGEEKEEDGLNLYRSVEEDPSYENVGPQVLQYMAESRLTRQRLIDRARRGHRTLQAALDEIGVAWRDTVTDKPSD